MSIDKQSPGPNPKEQTQNREKAPLNTPQKEADSRIAKASRTISSKNNEVKNRQQKLSSENAKNDPNRKEMDRIFQKTKNNTIQVLDGRIARAQATLKSDSEEYKRGTLGKRMDTMFKIGGLLGKTVTGSILEGIKEQEVVLRKLQTMRVKVLSAQTEDALRQPRMELGLAAELQELSANYDTYQEAVKRGYASKDSDLEVNWIAINTKLRDAEGVLDQWETALQTIDTGVSIAAGMVPYGSEVYQLSRSCTSVAIGTMTAEQAAKEFVIGVIASKVGGKAMSKLKIGEFAAIWAKKNASFFSKKTSEALASITGRAAAGGTQGALTGTAEGAIHGTYDVTTGKATTAEAIADTKKRAITGAVFGGVLAGAGEGLKIRGERKTAKQKVLTIEEMLQIPDTPQGREMRIAQAEQILEKSLSPKQHTAIWEAHNVPMKDSQKYSKAELAQKMKILETSGLSKKEAKQLLRKGVCGKYTSYDNYDGDDDGIELHKGDSPVKKKNTSSNKQSNQQTSEKNTSPQFYRGDTVRVQRSSGKIDDGWTIVGPNEDGTVSVRKFEDGQWKTRDPSWEELSTLNKQGSRQSPPKPGDKANTQRSKADQFMTEIDTNLQQGKPTQVFYHDNPNAEVVAILPDGRYRLRVRASDPQYGTIKKDVTADELISWNNLQKAQEPFGSQRNKATTPNTKESKSPSDNFSPNERYRPAQKVRIERSDGTIEENWFIVGYNEQKGTYRVFKDDKSGKYYDVTAQQLDTWSKLDSQSSKSNSKPHTPENSGPRREVPSTPVEARLQAAEKQIRSQLQERGLDSSERAYLEYSLADVEVQLDKTLSPAEKYIRRQKNLEKNRNILGNDDFNKKMERLMQEEKTYSDNSKSQEKQPKSHDKNNNNQKTPIDSSTVNQKPESTTTPKISPINPRATMFEILGISPNAPFNDVRKAYQKFFINNHPDKTSDPQEKKNRESNLTIINDRFDKYKKSINK